MPTEWISPTWRMPENSNQNKFENYSLEFDGSSDYISMGDVLDQANDGSDPISITFWLKTTLSALGYLVSKQTGFTDGYGVFMLASGEIAFYMGTSSSSARIYAYTQNTFNDGSWKNVAVTYDGSQDVSGLNIYVDNSLQTLTTVTNNTPNNVSNAGDFTLAKRNGSAYAYEGSLAEVLIFNSALTTDQITALYASGTPVNPMALTPLPIAYYPLGKGSTGSASTLTVPNDAVPSATVFDFDSSRIQVSNQSLGITSQIAISAWVKIPDGSTGGASPNVQQIVSEDKTSGTSRNWVLSWRGGSYKDFSFAVFHSDGTNTGTYSNVGDINDGKWHHVVGTWDGTTNANAFKIYVDNVATSTTSTKTDIRATSTVPTTIGAIPNTFTWAFDGNISNVQIWDTNLSSTEIETLYNNGVPLLTGTQPQAANLKGWWKMNVDTSTWDGSDWSITDSSGEGNTGTSFGMTTANLVTSDLTRSIPYSSYSMVFDGIDDYIELDSAKSFANEFSLSIWVKPDGLSNNQVILGNSSSSSNWARLGSAGQITFKIAGTSLNFNDVGNNLVDGVWQHLLLYRDSSNNVGIYRNGTAFSTTQTNTDTLTLITIGRRGTLEYTGNISNVAFWSSSLTEDQVLTIYNGGVPNDISSLSPVNWWSLAGDSYYDGTNWICPDLGSGSNNGTSNGMGGTELVGDGPGSTANGIATSMDIPGNLEGNAPNSTNNALSVNMTAIDRVTSVPG